MKNEYGVSVSVDGVAGFLPVRGIVSRDRRRRLDWTAWTGSLFKQISRRRNIAGKERAYFQSAIRPATLELGLTRDIFKRVATARRVSRRHEDRVCICTSRRHAPGYDSQIERDKGKDALSAC